MVPSEGVETGYEDPVIYEVISTWLGCPLYVFPSITVLVTGQMVVYSDTVLVVTCPTGQFSTVGAQDVTVIIFVE